MIDITHITSHLWQKLADIIQYPAGWFMGFLLFIVDALSGGRLIIYIVIIATVIDLFCGIAVSIKRRNFAKSELMRLTVEKLVVYGTALLVFLCIDKAIAAETNLELALSSGLIGVVITMAETWSFLASLLILFPKNPFLRLLSKALIGEIARKLQCSEEEVKEALELGLPSKEQKKATAGKDMAGENVTDNIEDGEPLDRGCEQDL
ncbi:MAG: hypothetical protein IJK73_06980 [Bacteroidales bacterium]|nr:hypothetical protein [Bacteroidales bacterium]